MLIHGEKKCWHALLAGLILLGGAGACGSSGASKDGGVGVEVPPPDPTPAFVGTWLFDKEDIHAECPGTGFAAVDRDLSGEKLVVTKIGENRIQAKLLVNCAPTFAVSGDTATADPGQKCTIPVGQLQPVVDLTSWIMITDDGVSLTTTHAGTALTGNCTVTGSGMATKQP